MTTYVVNSIDANSEVYPLQLYVIQLVSDLWYVSAFIGVLRFYTANKTDIKYSAKTETGSWIT
jgi:hypothetical protein